MPIAMAAWGASVKSPDELAIFLKPMVCKYSGVRPNFGNASEAAENPMMQIMKRNTEMIDTPKALSLASSVGFEKMKRIRIKMTPQYKNMIAFPGRVAFSANANRP